VVFRGEICSFLAGHFPPSENEVWKNESEQTGKKFSGINDKMPVFCIKLSMSKLLNIQNEKTFY